MNKTFFLIIASIAVIAASAQNRSQAQWHQELPNPEPVSIAEWQTAKRGGVAGFADKNIRYPKAKPVLTALDREWKTTAWRGERVHTQLVLQTDELFGRVAVEGGALKGANGERIAAENVSLGFVRYVLANGLNDNGGGCGVSPERQEETSLSADMIDLAVEGRVEAYTVQPFWLTIDVPQDTRPGIYKGQVTIRADRKTFKLPYSIDVKEHVLPAAAEWDFYLDLWQNPYSVARYYDVEVWSDSHFKLMEPYMKMLADAGQKVVTVSMIYDPWRGQTYDIYESMIRWVKHTDGSWSYDYSIFDKWVEFMESMGISKVINCYTMVPWNNKFYYYDESTGRDTVLVAKAETPELHAHWTPMLRDFARHLKQKGWFERTTIAMDERPVKDMLDVIQLVKSIDPDFKISLAGSYHPEIESDIYDYSIALRESYPADILKKRLAASKPTTFYTCCAEGSPNTFTFSTPAEATWMGWHAASGGYGGYLRWAYNCWPKDPLYDSRHRAWSSGDTYLVYPGPRSSIRFERLREGIQDYEKVRILMNKFEKEGRGEETKQLLELLKDFETAPSPSTNAAKSVDRAQKFINSHE